MDKTSPRNHFFKPLLYTSIASPFLQSSRVRGVGLLAPRFWTLPPGGGDVGRAAARAVLLLLDGVLRLMLAPIDRECSGLSEGPSEGAGWRCLDMLLEYSDLAFSICIAKSPSFDA